MKNIFKLMALFAFVLCFASCDDDEKVEIPALPVTAANLNGTWQLSEWNGQALAEVISGEYDFGNGDWNNDYIVTDLLESGSMIWTVKDDDSDVNKYVRCEKVPESIIEEAKTNKN